MSPLLKKLSFRVKKLKRPLIFDTREKRSIFIKDVRRDAIIILITLLIIGFISSGKLPIRAKLNEGDIATEDIYAPFSFSYEAGIDETKTKRAQETASKEVIDIYSFDPAPLDKAKILVEDFFDKIISVKEAEQKAETEPPPAKLSQEPLELQLQDIRSKLPVSLKHSEIKALLDYPDTPLLKAETIRILEEVFSQPIISDETRASILDSKKKQIVIEDGPPKGKRSFEVSGLLSASEPRKIIDPILSRSGIDQKGIRLILYKLISSCIEANTFFSEQRTKAAQRAASSSVAPIYKIVRRMKGESIIRKGQQTTREHLAQLKKISSSYAAGDIFSQLWGIVVLICLLTFLLLAYLKYFEPAIFAQDKLLLLVGLLVLFAALSARIVVSSPLPSYFIPVAAVSMLLTLLVNGSVAAIAVMAAAIIAALTAGAKFNIFLVSMVGGISAICAVYSARNRSQIIRSGLYIGILNFITICAIGILSNFEIKIFLKEGLWGVANGITAAALTMIFLPVLESAFNLSTDIRLLELSDLNHPLLKEMAMKAAGTYHHSMVVGNLAEAACAAIGANPLLARIGSYYHDIGKIGKAEYFAENQRDFTDVHSRLEPSMSSLIITNHVKDGVELAEKHKLANSIKDIIEQHHGSGLVTYFYHQALQKTEGEKPVSEEGFRYPGPKPQTKETAIVLLADSVEAASRTLPNPTPLRLKELVRKIINNKFIDRQLDACDLTLRDIDKIASSFVRILTGIYHSRVEYPGPTQNKHADNRKRKK